MMVGGGKVHSQLGESYESYSNQREENQLSTLHLGQFPETSLHKSPISSGHISKSGMLGSQGQEEI